MINLSLDEEPYHQLVSKLHKMAREEVGDQIIPLELQQKPGTDGRKEARKKIEV